MNNGGGDAAHVYGDTALDLLLLLFARMRGEAALRDTDVFCYVAINFIHQLMNSIHHLDTHFHPQTLIGPLSAVPRPIAAIKYSFESA